MDRVSNEEIIELVKKFLKKINNEFKIEKAILFGSRSRGDWLYTSDIDLIIISDDFEKINFLDRISIIAEKWEHMIEIQPICYTKTEFERKKQQIGIVSQAVKEGKEIAIT